jgi:hypothetical protein
VGAADDALVATTLAIIAYEGRDVALVRPAGLIPDGAGGHARSGSPTALAPVRRWFGHPVAAPEALAGEQGEAVRRTGILVGPPGDNLHEEDRFTLDGHTWSVVTIHRPAHEVRARCVEWEDGDG